MAYYAGAENEAEEELQNASVVSSAVEEMPLQEVAQGALVPELEKASVIQGVQQAPIEEAEDDLISGIASTSSAAAKEGEKPEEISGESPSALEPGKLSTEVMPKLFESRARSDAMTQNNLNANIGNEFANVPKVNTAAVPTPVSLKPPSGPINNKRKTRKNKTAFGLTPSTFKLSDSQTEPPAKKRGLTRRLVNANNNTGFEMPIITAAARAKQPSFSKLKIEPAHVETRESRTEQQGLEAAQQLKEKIEVGELNDERINNLESKLHPLAHAKRKAEGAETPK